VSRFAVAVMLPEPLDDPTRCDFVAREFDSWDEVPALMAEVEAKAPNWRLVTFCHVEDLPMLMEGPRPE
jgi:hypothetical protein